MIIPSISIVRGSRLVLAGLADLAADMLALIANALAMIYLRLAHAAHVGGELPDLLLINALNNNFILRGNFYGDTAILKPIKQKNQPIKVR